MFAAVGAATDMPMLLVLLRGLALHRFAACSVLLCLSVRTVQGRMPSGGWR